MAFIDGIPVAQASGDVRGMYEKTQAAAGYVPNYAKVFSHRPQVMAAEIFDIAATAAARCFFSKLLDALGAEPDAAFAALEDDLKRQLTPGRPISRQAPEKLA